MTARAMTAALLLALGSQGLLTTASPVAAQSVRSSSETTVPRTVAPKSSGLTMQRLQRLLKSEPRGDLRFHELRESPWLAQSIESRGTMHASADVLEKRVEQPRAETWRILPDRMQWISSPDTMPKEILFDAAPAAGTLATALRRMASGDLIALQSDFVLEIQGDESDWTIMLRPKTQAVHRTLDHLEMRGQGGFAEVMIIVERGGERTTTRLSR